MVEERILVSIEREVAYHFLRDAWIKKKKQQKSNMNSVQTSAAQASTRVKGLLEEKRDTHLPPRLGALAHSSSRDVVLATLLDGSSAGSPLILGQEMKH